MGVARGLTRLVGFIERGESVDTGFAGAAVVVLLALVPSVFADSGEQALHFVLGESSFFILVAAAASARDRELQVHDLHFLRAGEHCQPGCARFALADGMHGAGVASGPFEGLLS